ncbi:MAG: hypothetical protein HGB12_18005 [Bacteroidetes bacterium]|nr:hypothetical protein [Bacteroidota bacterium]
MQNGGVRVRVNGILNRILAKQPAVSGGDVTLQRILPNYRVGRSIVLH